MLFCNVNEELKNLRPLFQLIRSIVYSTILTIILLILFNAQLLIEQNIYGVIGFLGLTISALEIFFTSKYLNIHLQHQNKNKRYLVTHHVLNHSFYPLVTYFALCLFLLIENSPVLAYSLIGINAVLMGLYLYFLPYHIIFDHKDHPASKYSSIKTDFILFVFKFFSFYIANLALFTFYGQYRISFTYLTLSVLSLSFLYLFFHLFRKSNYTKAHTFMALLFAVIYSFFSLSLVTYYPNVNAMIATLFFYLTAAIFYHKADGTFSYKILLEYSSLALIVSVIIFSIR